MAGLRFLLAVVPALLALLAEFFRFLLLVVVCRAGSALARPAERNRGNAKNIMHTDGDKVREGGDVCGVCVFDHMWRHTGVQTKLCKMLLNMHTHTHTQRCCRHKSD